jgi:hypothetical protein
MLCCFTVGYVPAVNVPGVSGTTKVWKMYETKEEMYGAQLE